MSSLADRAIATSGYLAVDTDSDVQAWLNTVRPLHGTPSSARQTLLHNLVVGLKADGVWSKLDRLWVFAQEMQSGALVDFIGRSRATPVNAPAFALDRGFTGNGSTSYIDSNWNPTSGPNYALNNAHISVWTALTDTQFRNALGNQTTSPSTSISTVRYQVANTAWFGAVNDNTGILASTFGATAGHVVVSRTSSSALNIYGNGGNKNSDGANSSVGIPNFNFLICAINASGTPGGYFFNQVSAVSSGASLTDTDVSNFYSRLRTYMTAVGVP